MVRPARPDELAAVGELTVAAYLADGLVPDDHWYVEELRDAVDRAEHGTVLVAVGEDGGLLGTVTVVRPPSRYAEVAGEHEAELRMLAVAPGARRCGVGELLVRTAMGLARAAGAWTLALTTLTTMASARRLYERLGLHRAPERDWGDAAGYTFLVYTAPLSQEVP
ncbi:GNAT family N-acetyltransferase [Actinotalea sp. JY-7885]|uniref:GNAT family N-acetyltransferase n=1 Tax=Actinotalea sp. JY-7885 TaxID=2758576 RepID=UPI001CB6F521|nr:GNAT family N-acetyltransferase [Actinotalea sp. JY-7885]